MVALEAMAAGRPVVCTDQVGAAEHVTAAGAGTVVPVGRIHDLAEALAVFLDHAEAAERAGTRGRDAVRDRCDPDAAAAAREQLYQEAIVARRRRLAR
jgi:glycosyltransferase involved in cell wall biosynthesis